MNMIIQNTKYKYTKMSGPDLVLRPKPRPRPRPNFLRPMRLTLKHFTEIETLGTQDETETRRLYDLRPSRDRDETS